MRRWLVLASLAAASPAWAVCPAPVGSDALLADLGAAQDLARAGDVAAGDAAQRLIADVSCFNEPLTVQIAGMTYRAIAAAAYTSGDAATGLAWLTAARSADPTGDYGEEDLPADHPVYAAARALDEGELPAAVAVGGRVLAAGSWTLDGKALRAAEARPGMPHVLQRVDASGGVSTWRIDGNAFPDEALSAGAAPSVATKACPEHRPHRRYAVPGVPIDVNGDCKVDALPQRPPEKTPLMMAGAAILAGAGATYVYAGVARDQFDAALTADEAYRYGRLTNRAIVASGAAAAVGVAALGWSVVLIDGAVTPTVRARF